MTSRRGPLPENLGPFKGFLDSYAVHLQVAELSQNTQTMYLDAARWFAGWLLTNTKVRSWGKVTRDELRMFFVHMHDIQYTQGYRNNIARCLQAYFKWYAAEEDAPDPFTTFKAPPPPKAGANPKPIIEMDQLKELIRDAEKGRDFESRRDAALLRLFACTGCRLSEITNLQVDDISIQTRTAVVTGKGAKTRTVKFDAKTAMAFTRYLRSRAEHTFAAGTTGLWLGRGRAMPLTPSGVRQAIIRRGARLGIKVHPHLFRHTFSHNWLDQGGSEGDLMELNGWDSPQMLRHYGASAKAARARRAYDRINVMGDI